jgi:hypothetical protein
MECKTIKSFNKRGKPKFALKVKHNTFEEADKEARRLNSKKGVFIKRVAYKCGVCETYHVGTTFEMLENKPKKVTAMSLFPKFKVVDTIDLSQFEKKPVVKRQKVMSTKGTLYLQNGLWQWELKKKTVKVINYQGKVKFPKIVKICPDASKLTSNKIKLYIKSNYLPQKKKEIFKFSAEKY